MGDNKTLDRPIAAENSPIRSDQGKVMDSVATEWTDEKHKLYLNSIEASFVKQLYNSEYGSHDLFGCFARAQIHTNSSRSDLRSQSFGQFKVMRRGCWEKPEFERANSQYENQNEFLRLSENPWIQHFRSHSTAKAPNQMDENNLVGQSTQIISLKHGREATSSKQTPPFCSHKVHEVSVGSITEVSDQNFVDVEVERGDALGRSGGTKRARSEASLITDQVVPFVAPTSEKTDILKENNEEMNLQNMGEPLQTEPRSSLCKDQQPNDPKLDGG